MTFNQRSTSLQKDFFLLKSASYLEGCRGGQGRGGVRGGLDPPVSPLRPAPSAPPPLLPLVGVIADQLLAGGQHVLDDLAELGVNGLALDAVALGHQLDPFVHTNITRRGAPLKKKKMKRKEYAYKIR